MVIVASAWKQVSYNFIFFLAGLQSIPRAVTEAARMDGARGWHRFRTITFPLLAPTTFFLLVVNLVYAAFDTFGTIYALTQGGPGKDTETLVIKVYRDGMVNQDHRLLVGAVGGADGGRDRADRDPVPLHGPPDQRMSRRHSPPPRRAVLPRSARLAAHSMLARRAAVRAAGLAGVRRFHPGFRRDYPGDLSLLPRLRPSAYPRVLTHGTHGHRAGLAHAAGFRRHGAGDRGRQDRHLDPVRLRRGVLPLSRSAAPRSG